MKKPDDLGQKIILGIAVFAATRMVLMGTENAWSAVTKQLPPPEQTDSEVSAKEELAWVLISGLAVALVRVFVRRSFPEARRRYWKSRSGRG